MSEPQSTAITRVRNDSAESWGVRRIAQAGRTVPGHDSPQTLAPHFDTAYFSFTKSNTKIAHTPTVTGN
jgi:hypothetical protein